MSSKARFGQDNANWKNAGWHVCHQCGADFHNYNKDAKFCSPRCYHDSRPRKPKKPKLQTSVAKRLCPYCMGYIHSYNGNVQTCGSAYCRKQHFAQRFGEKPTTICLQCGVEFEHRRGVARKYCSYNCHIESGGAVRAGEASVMAVKKYGAKKDANHAEIVAALRKCGVGVFDASDIGRGFPDLICGHRQLTHLVEIKNEKTPYGRAGLNEKQKKWARKWTGGPVYVIKNIQDVKSFAEGRFDELYDYGGYYNENVTDREIVRD